MGILDHRIPKKNFAQKIKTKILQQKFFTAPKFPDLQYVCMYVSVHYMKGLCMSYLEDGMYVCTCPCGGLYVYVYVHPTWWLCACVHTYTYIPFRYNPQIGHTHNAYPAPGRMDTHTFQNTHTFSTHSPCRMNAHMYIPPSRQDTHYPLCTHLLRRANTIVSRKYAPPGA